MREIIVDLFAGGGGVSQGIFEALGVHPDEAINHDEDAIVMHERNHPETHHWIEDVFDKKTHPERVARGRPVGFLWLSPDCTHHSRAKGSTPVNKSIRGLAWVAVKWAKAVRPRIIMLENVPEFRDWGPTMKIQRKDRKTGKMETVEVPDPKKRGMTFNLFCNQLRGLGYEVQYRDLLACDYGAPTSRKRFFLIARNDRRPIVWPEPTHGPEGNLFGLKPYRTAAECIDWTIPCPSIFERKKPLAEATLKRIAKGLKKYVLDAQEPFIVTCNHGGEGFRGQGLRSPLCTITAAHDAHGLVLPYLSKYHGEQGSETRGQRMDQPLRTQDTSNRFALVTAFLSKYFTGVVGSDLKKPLPTITAIDHNALVATHLTKFYGTNIGSDMREPMPTVTATGQHIGEVRALLLKYYGCGIGQITTKDRFGLVTVQGQRYQIADIGLRMLQPRELASAQGFPAEYILTGTKSNQVAKIGNSVPPPVVRELVKANVELKQIKAVG